MSVKSGFHVCMHGYSHSSTNVLFPCCTCTCRYFFKNLYTIKLLEDRPVSVCTVKYLNLQRNARNLDWLSVPVHRTFLRDQQHCTKRSTPLQLSPVCFNLFTAVVCCSMIQQFAEMCTILKEIPLKWRFRQFFKTTPCQTWGILMQTDQLWWLTFKGYLCKWHGYVSAKYGMNFSNS